MEYLVSSSIPVSKSELEIFSIPPTQTAVESYYDTEYRPSASLESGKTIEIFVSPSEDFTDLSATMVSMRLNIKPDKDISKTIRTVKNFYNALFEQVDFFLGPVNVSPQNNMYHYQSFIEDLMFRHPNKSEQTILDSPTRSKKVLDGSEEIDFYFRLHSPLCEQDKLMINNMPITLRFSRSARLFPFISDSDSSEVDISISHLGVHIRRVKVFPEAQISILQALETSPAKYFITRNDTKSFTIPAGLSSVNIENIFVGQLPRRVLIGLVDEGAFSGNSLKNPFHFQHCNVNFIAVNIDGINYPSIPYAPNFEKGLISREYVSLWKFFGQDEGVPQLEINIDEYLDSFSLFAFDLSSDSTVGAETGVLSLVKRGSARLEIKFGKPLSSVFKIIVFAQHDNLIAVSSDRAVTLDY